jgi:hypothetical protein
MICISLAGVCGAMPGLAQTNLVVPGTYATTTANTSDNAPLGAVNQHIQQVFSASLLANSGLRSGAQLTGLGFRIAANQSGLAAQTVSDYSIWMGLAANAPGNLSSNLTDNGVLMTQVRSGSLTITAGQFSGGQSVNPFGYITFNTPYAYLGGDLLIDISDSGFSSGANVDAAWPYDSTLAQTAFGSGPAATTADAGVYNEAIVMAFIGNWSTTIITAVPEPATGALLVLGTIGLLARWRRTQ